MCMRLIKLMIKYKNELFCDVNIFVIIILIKLQHF